MHGLHVLICRRTCRGAHNGWIVKWNTYDWKRESKDKPKTKDRYVATEAAVPVNVHHIGQWLRKNKIKNAVENHPYVAIFSCICAIILQKQVRCPFAQSHLGRVVWFSLDLRMYLRKWTRCTSFWLLPLYIYVHTRHNASSVLVWMTRYIRTSAFVRI